MPPDRARMTDRNPRGMQVIDSERSTAERPASLWRRSRPLTLLLSLAAFAVCVFYVVTRFQWRAAFEVLARVDYLAFVAAVCSVHLGYILLRTWR